MKLYEIFFRIDYFVNVWCSNKTIDEISNDSRHIQVQFNNS